MKKIILLDFGMDLIDFSRGSATPFDAEQGALTGGN